MKSDVPAPTPSGVNGSFFLSGVCAAVAAALWPEHDSHWQQHLFAWFMAFGTAANCVGGCRAWAKDVRNRRLIEKSEAESTEHGSAREATKEEIIARGCADPDAGIFIGFKDDIAIFAPKDAPFTLIEAPPGSGKDINLAIGDILHHSLRGISCCAPDVKLELGPMLANGLREAGVELWCVNPTEQFLDLCGDVELGLYDPLVKAVHSEGERRKDAIGIAEQFARLHLPDKDTDKSKLYFVGGSRRLIKVVALLKALIDPANCNPASVLFLLNDVEQLVATLKAIVTSLEPVTQDDRIVVELKSEAKNLLHRHETNPENFGSFVEWATQSLASYKSYARKLVMV